MKTYSKKKQFIVAVAACATLSAGAMFEAKAQQVLPEAEQKFSTRHEDVSRRDLEQVVPHIGLLGGVSEVPNDNAGGLVGVDVGIQPAPPFSVGLNFAVAGPTQDETRTMLMSKGAFNFGGNVPIIKYSYVGLNLGWIRDSVEITEDVKATNNYFALGPVIGFDQPVATHWTVGAEGKYLGNFEDDTQENDSMLLQFALKYWM